MLNAETSDASFKPEKEAYTVKEVSQLVKPALSTVSVYRLLYRDELKVLSGFGRIMIPRSELEKFFNRVVTYTPRKSAKKTVKKVAEAAR
jgi:hypothetical protein